MGLSGLQTTAMGISPLSISFSKIMAANFGVPKKMYFMNFKLQILNF